MKASHIQEVQHEEGQEHERLGDLPGLTEGQIYKNRGGGSFRCLSVTGTHDPILTNVESGWTFTAHTITMYRDGTIEWDYSTGGCWR